MPKRILDGEGLWSSDKLARVEPEWVRAEYANLIPLALSNGVFECSVRRVWRDVYGYNRPSMTEKRVAIILESLEKEKLLFRFDFEGKKWGYWVGIDRPGRLPSADRRGTHEKQGPEPPIELLQYFLMDTIGCREPTTGLPVASSARAGTARPTPTPNPNPTPNPTPTPSEEVFELPDWVPAQEWSDFAAMRLNMRKPIRSEKQAAYLVRQLERLRLGGNDPREVLEQSIANNWQGIFPLKGQQNGRQSVADQNRRNAQIALERHEARAASAGRAE